MTTRSIVLGILTWCLISVLIGLVGSRRKIGFAWTFVLSLILTPIVGLIAALTSPKLPHGGEKCKIHRTEHSRKYIIAFAKTSIVLVWLKLKTKDRTRTDDCHCSIQYVEYLRKFIERSPSEERSHFGYTRILLRSYHSTLFKSILAHSAELVHSEWLLVLAKTLLLEKSRSLTIALDDDCNDNHWNSTYG